MAEKSRVATQLDKLRATLEAERDEVQRNVAPLYKRREALVKKIQPLEDELRKLDEEIKAVEKPLYEISSGLATLARAGGARILANGTEIVPPSSPGDAPVLDPGKES